MRVQISGFRVQGSGFRVQGSGFKVQGSECRVKGSGFRVQGSGFRVEDSGIRDQGSGGLTHNQQTHLAIAVDGKDAEAASRRQRGHVRQHRRPRGFLDTTPDATSASVSICQHLSASVRICQYRLQDRLGTASEGPGVAAPELSAGVPCAEIQGYLAHKKQRPR